MEGALTGYEPSCSSDVSFHFSSKLLTSFKNNVRKKDLKFLLFIPN